MEAFEYTHSYYRFPNEVLNRLDVLFNDTVFDVLTEYEKRSKFPFKELRDVVDFRKEKRNPQLNSKEDFIYTDIGSIDIVFGEPIPSVMQGEEAHSSRMRQIMRYGDVLLSTTRPFRNAICITPEILDNQICSTGFSVLIPKNITSKFVFLALRSKIGNMQLQKLCSGSGYPAINQEIDVPTILIPCPLSKNDQDRIVDAIQPFEDQAKLLKTQATKLQNEAVNFLLKKLQIEIPENPTYFFKTGSENKSINFTVSAESLTDRIHYLHYHPKYQILEKFRSLFKTVTLESICSKEVSPGIQPKFVENGDRIVLKTIDLKNRFIDYNNALKVSEEFYIANTSAEVHKGDIIIAATGYVSMGKIDVYDKEEPALISGELLSFRPNENYDPYFIAYFLRCHLGQIQIEKYWTGSSGQIHLYAKDVKNFILPSHESISKMEQTEIANVIRKMIEDSIKLEDAALEKLSASIRQFEELILNEII